MKKRILAAVLVLVLAVSLAVPAFAYDKKTGYREYGKYLCLGDSIAAGCGLSIDGNETTDFSDYGAIYSGHDFQIAGDNAYHSIVAKALGSELLMDARSGFRAVELRYILDGVYNDYDPTKSFGNTFLALNGDGFGLDDVKQYDTTANISGDIKDADLITLNYGSNDVFTTALVLTVVQLAEKNPANAALAAIADELADGGDIGAAFKAVFEAYSAVDSVVRLINDLNTNMNKCLSQFATNFNAVVRSIYKKNPDVTIAAIGVYNPVANLRLTSYDPIQLNGLLDATMAEVNAIISAPALVYNNYYYVDVVGTETYKAAATDPDFLNAIIYKVHPTIGGYRFMADRILNQLKDTDVSVTLSKATKVSSVSLNGLPVLKYTFDAKTHALTVPCTNKLASSLSVTEVRSNGTYTVNYLLRWTDSGYTAVKLTESKVPTALVSAVVSTVTSAVKSLTSGLLKLR